MHMSSAASVTAERVDLLVVVMKRHLPVLLMILALLGIAAYTFIYGSDACRVAVS